MPDNNYEQLKARLEESTNWPCLYMFKFIIPADNRRIALVEALFGNEADIKLHESRNGKYVSISVKAIMNNADEIISRYEAAEKIEGIISL